MTVIEKKRSKTLFYFYDCYVIARDREHAIKLRDKWLKEKESEAGFEPAMNGFADRRLSS